MRKYLPAALIGALIALLSARASADTGYRPRPRGDWANPEAPAQIRELAGKLERELRWPGLADYLVAVGYWESMGDYDAREDNTPNSARGLFQVRPKTADHPAILENPELLYDPEWAIASAADLIWRLNRWRLPGQPPPNWLAIRRGWKYPKLVRDVDELDENSRIVRLNLAAALDYNKMPASFMLERAVPANVRWPGIDAALAILRR